MPFIWGNWSRS